MGTRLKVLNIIPNLAHGGAERMAVNLMCGLAKRGLDVRAVSLFDRSATDLEAELDAAGIPVWYLGKRLGFDIRVYARLNQVLRQFRPDVVHTHRYVLRYAWPLPAYQRVRGKVHTVHSVAQREVDRPGKWVHFLAFRTGVTPVAIADAVLTSLRNLYRLAEVPLIPNGIPVLRYASPSMPSAAWRRQEGMNVRGVIIFVSIGRLADAKNPSLLLEAFRKGPAQMDAEAQLVFVGQGPLRATLEEQAKVACVAHRVRFLGLRTDIPDVLAASDVFVSSSDYEGNPLAVMEAMAAGKPVIATTVGGVPELVEQGKTGLLVPPGDVHALAESMNRLLQDGSVRMAMGRQGADRAMHLFDVSKMVEAYERLYLVLLKRETA